MANSEIAYNKSPVYTYDFPAMSAQATSSTTVNASAIPNFFAVCSKILGVSLVSGTGAGAVSAGLKEVASATGSAFPVVVLSSANNTDTAVYRMYFINEIAQSPYVTIKSC